MLNNADFFLILINQIKIFRFDRLLPYDQKKIWYKIDPNSYYRNRSNEAFDIDGRMGDLETLI